jgi:hypothetical protein
VLTSTGDQRREDRKPLAAEHVAKAAASLAAVETIGHGDIF